MCVCYESIRVCLYRAALAVGKKCRRIIRSVTYVLNANSSEIEFLQWGVVINSVRSFTWMIFKTVIELDNFGE